MGVGEIPTKTIKWTIKMETTVVEVLSEKQKGKGKEEGKQEVS